MISTCPDVLISEKPPRISKKALSSKKCFRDMYQQYCKFSAFSVEFQSVSRSQRQLFLTIGRNNFCENTISIYQAKKGSYDCQELGQFKNASGFLISATSRSICNLRLCVLTLKLPNLKIHSRSLIDLILGNHTNLSLLGRQK